MHVSLAAEEVQGMNSGEVFELCAIDVKMCPQSLQLSTAFCSGRSELLAEAALVMAATTVSFTTHSLKVRPTQTLVFTT